MIQTLVLRKIMRQLITRFNLHVFEFINPSDKSSVYKIKSPVLQKLGIALHRVLPDIIKKLSYLTELKNLATIGISKMTEFVLVSNNKCFGGWQKVYSHESTELKCKMNFGVYLPPQSESGPVPVIYWLSGLTCTEANFIQKAGAQKYAAEHGVMIVVPDTSPRGLNIPGEETSWDFGTGASFYLDATVEPWKNNYRMYSYVTKELPALINEKFPANPDKQSIMGHSMGGHGALICCLKNPGQYKAVSAFAPICNPLNSHWGQKAFSGYLGENQGQWKDWDSTELLKSYNGPPLDILIDQGREDNFLAKELLPENLVTAAQAVSMPLTLRMQDGYDHSYFFIATFIEDHIKHHAKYLKS